MIGSFSKSSIAGKYERNRYKFKFPEAPASATRAQPLSSGAIYDRIYGPICDTIHHYGIENSGGPSKAVPTAAQVPKVASIMVDGEIDGSIN